MKHPPRFTREIGTELGDKLVVQITPENNKCVVLGDVEMCTAVTLDPRAANQLGHALITAARLAAMNTLDPIPAKAEVGQ
jgi:hypothetical protein